MALFDAILELADDHLVLGHRLSEWCGHAPMLEEDLALPNMALDLIGTARTLYDYAAQLEGRGRTEDDLAYLRGERDYRNILLCERPNGDFAHTMLRQLYFAAFMEPYWKQALACDDSVVRGVAGKAVKEMAYHIRHSGEWVVRMGDGTEESAARLRMATADLEPFIDEVFEIGASLKTCLPDRSLCRDAWNKTIADVFKLALLDPPQPKFGLSGGRQGRHGEELGHMLAVMQSTHRAHPGATW